MPLRTPHAPLLARFALLLSLVFGCGSEADEPMRDLERPEPEPPVAEEAAPDPEAMCDATRAEAAAGLATLVEHSPECTFDVDCVRASLSTQCAEPCEVAIHPSGLRGLLEARVEAERTCREFQESGCVRAAAECPEASPRCVDSRCAMAEGEPPLREVSTPEANRAGQSSPPPRPAPGDDEQRRGRRLLRAILEDDPRLAQDFFFPREAFARVKAIGNADAYWQRLFTRYAADIHALHEQLTDEGLEPSTPPHREGAQFVALDIIPRGGWVPRGEEANALPYWVSRHSRLRYRVGEEERSFEVRVLITWGERWYITHLSEFH